MNTQFSNHDESPAGDDRWIDAIVREHARLGTRADEAFLQGLDRALDADAPTGKNLSLLRFRPVAIAAGVALLLTAVFWKGWERDGGNQGVAAAPGALDAGTELLTSFPPELIEGTPKPMKVPKLVGVPKDPPTLRVPEGTTLLSKGKPVTSSDDYPIIGDVSLITDGDKDAGEGYYVELLDGLQWVQIDLEQRADIRAVWLWHFHSQRRAYHDVIVQVSDDPSFKSGVTTIYNNDYDGSAGMEKGEDHPYVESRFGLLVNAKGTKGRYVRLYSNGNTSNDMNHYIEVEVFGVAGN
ncbi:hypothetical protein [Haloferula sp. A504]|uniref:hypothetical protein n=1 Tax=Haloferula sp. A504 TaxID=3373601 RepID=UPI0031C8EAE0|nr:hypothetical protein [Verrucomicrobiaceae bacterium E54]